MRLAGGSRTALALAHREVKSRVNLTLEAVQEGSACCSGGVGRVARGVERVGGDPCAQSALSRG